MDTPLTTSPSPFFARFIESSGVLVPAVYWLNSWTIKQGQNELNFQCLIVCTVLAKCPRYNTFMTKSASCETAYTLVLQHALYTYTLRSLSPSYVPGTCPHPTYPEHALIWCTRNMFPSNGPGICPLMCALHYINFCQGFVQVMVNKRLFVAWACLPAEANAG